ncbi:MAG TPA: hypothetical protein DIT28_19280 [Oxalobacteraceae bacterium]|nr:hypothetical protein [Oxalobacteraceae bacterium]
MPWRLRSGFIRKCCGLGLTALPGAYPAVQLTVGLVSVLLPSDVYARYAPAKELRVICDYVASMTDDFLLKTYEELFRPGMGYVFDKL